MPISPSKTVDGRRRRRSVAVLGLASLLLAGVVACGDNGDYEGPPDVATVAPATPGTAATGTPPAVGAVHPAPAGQTVTLAGDRIAALSADGNTLTLFDRGDPAQPAQRVSVPDLAALVPDGDGFLGVTGGNLVNIGADGEVREVGIATGDPLSVAVGPAENQILVGTADGRLMVYTRDGELEREIRGFVQVDEITVAPEGTDLEQRQVIVLDRAQSSVTPVDISDGELLAALRAGNGAGNATVDHYGRLLVTGTRDDEIFGFFGQPLVMRFRYPVPDSPFGLGYDEQRNLLWVSATEDNEVLAFDLGEGVPVPKYRFPTVAQPDALTVDSESGTVFVLSADGAGLQAVPIEAQQPVPENGGR